MYIKNQYFKLCICIFSILGMNNIELRNLSYIIEFN